MDGRGSVKKALRIPDDEQAREPTMASFHEAEVRGLRRNVEGQATFERFSRINIGGQGFAGQPCSPQGVLTGRGDVEAAAPVVGDVYIHVCFALTSPSGATAYARSKKDAVG